MVLANRQRTLAAPTRGFTIDEILQTDNAPHNIATDDLNFDDDDTRYSEDLVDDDDDDEGDIFSKIPTPPPPMTASSRADIQVGSDMIMIKSIRHLYRQHKIRRKYTTNI